jgi:hypothetical protein
VPQSGMSPGHNQVSPYLQRALGDSKEMLRRLARRQQSKRRSSAAGVRRTVPAHYEGVVYTLPCCRQARYCTNDVRSRTSRSTRGIGDRAG